MKKIKNQKHKSKKAQKTNWTLKQSNPPEGFLNRTERRAMVMNPDVVVVRERIDTPVLTAGMLRLMIENTPDDVPIGVEVETLDNPDKYGIVYLHYGWQFILDDGDPGEHPYTLMGNVALRFLPKAVGDRAD